MQPLKEFYTFAHTRHQFILYPKAEGNNEKGVNTNALEDRIDELLERKKAEKRVG
jgi:hypothetical protein